VLCHPTFEFLSKPLAQLASDQVSGISVETVPHQTALDALLNRVSAMYEKTTQAIKVSVRPYYLEDESDPSNNHYFWAYNVVVENEGMEAVQLVSRYWNITDVTGQVEEINGAGVVGEQPTLDPGESFEYTSGCPLSAPSGVMHGHYRMRTHDGREFQVAIPPFSLDLPDSKPTLN
jgi:ApaG protein